MEKVEIGSKILNAKFTNIPVLNLRMEFKRYYDFLNELVSKNITQINTVIDSLFIIWKCMPDDFFTLILQRGILGIESYVPGAVWEVLIRTGKYKKRYMRYLQNPYSLQGESVPDKYYNALPRLVHEDMSLKKCDYEDWVIIKDFYKKVRNPLFHGKQINDFNSKMIDPVVILDGYKVINKIYEWVDIWYPPELLWPGAAKLQVSNDK